MSQSPACERLLRHVLGIYLILLPLLLVSQLMMADWNIQPHHPALLRMGVSTWKAMLRSPFFGFAYAMGAGAGAMLILLEVARVAKSRS